MEAGQCQKSVHAIRSCALRIVEHDFETHGAGEDAVVAAAQLAQQPSAESTRSSNAAMVPFDQASDPVERSLVDQWLNPDKSELPGDFNMPIWVRIHRHSYSGFCLSQALCSCGHPRHLWRQHRTCTCIKYLWCNHDVSVRCFWLQ